MKPIEFKEMNNEFAKNQPEYITLPAHLDKDGLITSCWQMTWKERLKALFTGKVFSSIMTFHSALQPQRLTVDNPIKGDS